MLNGANRKLIGNHWFQSGARLAIDENIHRRSVSMSRISLLLNMGTEPSERRANELRGNLLWFGGHVVTPLSGRAESSQPSSADKTTGKSEATDKATGKSEATDKATDKTATDKLTAKEAKAKEKAAAKEAKAAKAKEKAKEKAAAKEAKAKERAEGGTRPMCACCQKRNANANKPNAPQSPAHDLEAEAASPR